MKNQYFSKFYTSIITPVLVVGLGLATPVFAQDNPTPIVKASDPSGVLAVLKQAGFNAKLNLREGDDTNASIAIVTRDGEVFVQFIDCDDAVPDFCDTLVLSTSWNRDTPMADSAIAEANRNFKYVSIWRDEDGDPVMQWAILTRDDGLSPPLFLNALQRYLDVVRDFDEIAFEGDEATEASVDAAQTT